MVDVQVSDPNTSAKSPYLDGSESRVVFVGAKAGVLNFYSLPIEMELDATGA